MTKKFFVLVFIMLFCLFGCKDSLKNRGIGGSHNPAGGNCETNGAIGTIENNHGHVLIIPDSDVLMSAAKTYDITGTAGHSHSVSVTVDGFNQLALKQAISLVSTSGGAHTHNVLVECR